MKKHLSLVIALSVLFCFCACSRASVDDASDVTLRYAWGDREFVQKLEGSEAERLARIFDNKIYIPDIPACYFDENISVCFGDKVFGVAVDGCGKAMDFGNGEYFNLSLFERLYIESLFGKYGATVFKR